MPRPWFEVVGTKLEPCEPRATKVEDHSEFLQELSAEEVRAMYVTPPLRSGDEKDSFNVQSAKVNYTLPPEDPVRKQALHRAEVLYSPARYHLPVDWGTEAHAMRICKRIYSTHGDKSSGAVLQRKGLTTIKQVFDTLGFEAVVALVMDRKAELLAHDPKDCAYIADAIRIFIKREPHSIKKQLIRRWRLIWGVSLVDRILDEMLYYEMVQVALRAHEDTPNKPGMNFKRGGTDVLYRRYARGGNGSNGWTSFDASGFDFSLSWHLEMVDDLNVRLCFDGPNKAEWERLLRRRSVASSHGEFVFSDGTLCRKTRAAVHHSGRFTTIDTNGKVISIEKILWDIRKGVPTDPLSFFAMGDDHVVKTDGDKEGWVENCAGDGITVTIESEEGPLSEQNFCSSRLKRFNGRYVSVPLNWNKNVYALAFPEKTAVDYTADRLFSLCLEYAFHDNFDLLYAALIKHFPEKCRSREWFQEVHTGFESAQPDWYEQCYEGA